MSIFNHKTQCILIIEPGDKMFDIERQEKILEILTVRKSVTVHTLAALVFASESTIRRDLSALEKSGRIRRTFGGAVLEETLTKEVPLLLRQSQNSSVKAAIAAQAKEYIHHGDVIFLDASSTVFHLIPHLSLFKDLTVITNSPKTSVALGEAGIRNFCTGGRLLAHSIAYVGKHAEDFIGRFNADLLFFSCRGYTPADGEITDSSVEESQIRSVMLRRANKKIFLCDSSKFGKKYMYRLCSQDEITCMLSDKKNL